MPKPIKKLFRKSWCKNRIFEIEKNVFVEKEEIAGLSLKKDIDGSVRQRDSKSRK